MNAILSSLLGNEGGLRQWVKRREHPLARLMYAMAKGVKRFELPLVKPFHGTIYRLHRFAVTAASEMARIFYWTPLFKSRLQAPAKGLYLYGGMPFLMGPLAMRFGEGCRVSGVTTFSGRGVSHETPRLIVGDNVDISWQTTIAVGREVRIGDNVRMAGQVFLAGYPGHPLDAKARASGEPETDDQVGDIILEDDVWLATRVTVNSGIRIGRGTIVAAGSVVTRDLPPNVLAGGSPARVIRPLTDTENGL